MTVDFCDYFWGEKNNGFDVLYQNTKHGQLASKELADFFKERAIVEESYSKMLAKLAHKANNAGVSGTFGPLWTLLRSSSEKLSSIHMAVVTRLSDIVKELQKYTDDLHKRQKTVKEEEAPTMEVVQSIQQLTASVLKAREVYQQRAAELRRLQEGASAGRDTDKAEAKLRRAADDYRALVEKYRLVRDDFERKMVISCRHFQELEENYLCQMKDFLDNYVKVCDGSHQQIKEVDVELRQQCDEKTVIKLLEEFALAKLTGLEKPALLEFEEVAVSPAAPSVGSTPDAVSETGSAGADGAGTATAARQGFLRGRRGKREKLPKKRDNEKSDSEENHKASPEVDEEGFSVRPRNDTDKKKRHDSFYSSSDSDSDDDTTSKIHVKINPLSNGGGGAISASVDELRNVTSALTLSPANTGSSKSPTIAEDDGGLRRSQSVSQQLGHEKSSNDLIGLSFHSPTQSNQSTPTAGGPHHPPTSVSVSASGSGSSSASASALGPAPTSTPPVPAANRDRYAELSEIFAESSDMPPALPPKHQPQPVTHRGATPTLSSIAIPRPPSRRSVEGGGTPGGRQSPGWRGPTRSASGGSTPRSEPPIGLSRGPSPLTLGLGDTVPLAVAFQEVVHAYFRGSDPSNVHLLLSRWSSSVSTSWSLRFRAPTPASLTFLTLLTRSPSPPGLRLRTQAVDNHWTVRGVPSPAPDAPAVSPDRRTVPRLALGYGAPPAAPVQTTLTVDHRSTGTDGTRTPAHAWVLFSRSDGGQAEQHCGRPWAPLVSPSTGQDPWCDTQAAADPWCGAQAVSDLWPGSPTGTDPWKGSCSTGGPWRSSCSIPEPQQRCCAVSDPWLSSRSTHDVQQAACLGPSPWQVSCGAPEPWHVSDANPDQWQGFRAAPDPWQDSSKIPDSRCDLQAVRGRQGLRAGLKCQQGFCAVPDSWRDLCRATDPWQECVAIADARQDVCADPGPWRGSRAAPGPLRPSPCSCRSTTAADAPWRGTPAVDDQWRGTLAVDDPLRGTPAANDPWQSTPAADNPWRGTTAAADSWRDPCAVHERLRSADSSRDPLRGVAAVREHRWESHVIPVSDTNPFVSTRVVGAAPHRCAQRGAVACTSRHSASSRSPHHTVSSTTHHTITTCADHHTTLPRTSAVVLWPPHGRPVSCHNPLYGMQPARPGGPGPRGGGGGGGDARSATADDSDGYLAMSPQAVRRPLPPAPDLCRLPLAVQLREQVHAHFYRLGPLSRCQVRMTGDTMVSFPSGIVQVLTSNPSPAPLIFRLNRTGRLESMLPNKHLITPELKLSGIDTAVFEFRMENLTALLRKQAERNPTASYFNVDILKYQILTQPGAASVPLHLVAYWKCESTHTDLKVEYRYNSDALSSPSALQNVTVAAPVDGGVTAMHSKPTGRWVAEANRAMWKIPELSSQAKGQGSGALKARFELSHGPGSPSTLAAQFSCEGSTLSGTEFQLLGSGYRLSLVKRRFVSGKYICDSDYIESSDRYAAPPGPV